MFYGFNRKPDKWEMMRERMDDYYRSARKRYDCADDEVKKKVFTGALAFFALLLFSMMGKRAWRRHHPKCAGHHC